VCVCVCPSIHKFGEMFRFAGYGGTHPLVQKYNVSLNVQKTKNVLRNSK